VGILGDTSQNDETCAVRDIRPADLMPDDGDELGGLFPRNESACFPKYEDDMYDNQRRII